MLWLLIYKPLKSYVNVKFTKKITFILKVYELYPYKANFIKLHVLLNILLQQTTKYEKCHTMCKYMLCIYGVAIEHMHLVQVHCIYGVAIEHMQTMLL